MRKFMLAAVLAGALMTAGCTNVLSLKPFVKEGAAILDPAMAGTWMESDGGDVYVIQPKEGNRYDIAYVPSGNNDQGQRFEGQLFASGSARFMDLTPNSGQCMFCWPAHALVRVWLTDTELRFAFVDTEWFRQQIEKAGLPFEPHDDCMLLMSDTATLTARVMPYAADSRAQAEKTGKGSGAVLHKKP